jgi:hypothetical protein
MISIKKIFMIIIDNLGLINQSIWIISLDIYLYRLFLFIRILLRLIIHGSWDWYLILRLILHDEVDTLYWDWYWDWYQLLILILTIEIDISWWDWYFIVRLIYYTEAITSWWDWYWYYRDWYFINLSYGSSP